MHEVSFWRHDNFLSKSYQIFDFRQLESKQIIKIRSVVYEYFLKNLKHRFKVASSQLIMINHCLFLCHDHLFFKTHYELWISFRYRYLQVKYVILVYWIAIPHDRIVLIWPECDQATLCWVNIITHHWSIGIFQ